MKAAKTALAAALGVTALCVCGSASAGQVQQITNFGSNPTGIGMYLYTPTKVADKPPILVGVHACHGKGTDVCQQGTGWVTEAEKYGFYLICPSSVSSTGCWDVHSSAVLTHGGGGDAGGIISMVNYVIQNKNADGNRVYVGGHSSGGMMTNVLLGSYPDVFKAGAAFAGVPFGCFAIGSADSNGWDTQCATGNVTETGAQWGSIVKAAYPGFTGTRPRVQLWHGTVDQTVDFHNFSQEIVEWTDVLGVSATPTTTENNAIQSGWIRTRYADSSGEVQVEAIQETGQPHNLVIDVAEAVHFFGLDGSNPIPDAGAKSGASDGGGSVDASAPDGATGTSGSSAGQSSGSGASGDGNTGASGLAGSGQSPGDSGSTAGSGTPQGTGNSGNPQGTSGSVGPSGGGSGGASGGSGGPSAGSAMGTGGANASGSPEGVVAGGTGASGNAASSTSTESPSSGCSVRAGGRGPSGAEGGWLLGLVVFLARRRRAGT